MNTQPTTVDLGSVLTLVQQLLAPAAPPAPPAVPAAPPATTVVPELPEPAKLERYLLCNNAHPSPDEVVRRRDGKCPNTLYTNSGYHQHHVKRCKAGAKDMRRPQQGDWQQEQRLTSGTVDLATVPATYTTVTGTAIEAFIATLDSGAPVSRLDSVRLMMRLLGRMESDMASEAGNRTG